MSNKQCLTAPAGAQWHSVKGPSSWDEKSSHSQVTTMLQAPVSRPNGRVSSALVSKAGNARRPRKSVNPVGRKGRGTWRDYTVGDAVDYGYKAWQLAKKISTLINVEEKIHDVDGTSSVTVTTAPTVINLSNIAQGTDYFNRVGDSILVQSMEFRAYASSSGAVSGHRLRLLIVADKEQNGTDPTIGEVLQGGTSPLLQPYNLFYEQRFNVLYDELIQINNPVGLATSGTSTSYLGQRADFSDMVRKWNKHIKYDASAAADASNRENALFLMVIGEQPTDGSSLRYTFRLRFTDN